ncbi:uncharacterized protein BO80DRAFT_505245 [Aspergillus ibericus CBS 121593]|uniref:Uncharacterized protein n=1 Tax=Aspergillus ibericus CBS 121593 TaxID=1448316 RepID=A0A395GRJ9_9EURO|nr:hypothetical protein BO80DRAFT_505245 [Aspergillus ibericus CBS 121593]RAK96703.1 hypothetical protein BO80DRAFT_505245 [Aspergillus ibericus CBS 121593]
MAKERNSLRAQGTKGSILPFGLVGSVHCSEHGRENHQAELEGGSPVIGDFVWDHAKLHQEIWSPRATNISSQDWKKEDMKRERLNTGGRQMPSNNQSMLVKEKFMRVWRRMLLYPGLWC